VAAAVTDLEVITEPLGGSPLSLAIQRGDVPERWCPARPSSAADWQARARPAAGEFAGGRWLSALQPALAPSGQAAERLRRVASARGVVVTTGQQPGLFGGPVYTFSKALSALTLADELEARTGVPVAPVFWAATDDADFAEARWTKLAVAGGVVRIELRDVPPAGTPMSLALLGDVGAELAELERASGSAPFALALDAVRESYRARITVGDAYVRLLRALLEPLGVAVLDASNDAVRHQGAAILREALTRAPEVANAVESRSAELRAAGFEPKVTEVGGLSLVSTLARGVKRRIPIAEAGASARTAPPETLAPNVLLRPILERAILPTVGYVGGPAELAYFAQVSAVSDVLGVETPLAVPRWSVTVIEPHVNRLLERLGARYSDLRDPHALEGRLARAAVPRSVVTTLAKLREAVDQAEAALTSDSAASSLVPEAAVVGAKKSLLMRLQRLERRYVAGVKRREQELMRSAATARAHLYPDGERQERALNFIPMLARHGPALLDAMREAALGHARALTSGSAPTAAAAAPVAGGRSARP
jgi:uncharacterized protein YllA (UPF0747 family)